MSRRNEKYIIKGTTNLILCKPFYSHKNHLIIDDFLKDSESVKQFAKRNNIESTFNRFTEVRECREALIPTPSSYFLHTRSMVLSPYCPTCGEERGAFVDKMVFRDGGANMETVWENLCGHLDSYHNVVNERNYLCDEVSDDK